MSEENTKDLTLDEKLDLLLAEIREAKAEVREVKAVVENLDARLTALESKVEERLHDTRPIWQRVQQQIEDLKIESNAHFASIEKELRIVNRQFEVFSTDMMKMRAEIRDFDERLAAMEQPAA